jgi:hypothetical protein
MICCIMHEEYLIVTMGLYTQYTGMCLQSTIDLYIGFVPVSFGMHYNQ